MAGPPRMPRARVRVFWRARIAGATIADAAVAAGVSESGAKRWMTECGGVIPDLDEPSGRFLSMAEREEIAAGWNQGLTKAEIACRIGRHRSSVGRELARNQLRRHPARPPRPDGQRHRPGPAPGTNRGLDRPQHERLRYRPSLAQAKAEARARRPKPGKLALRPELRAWVVAKLDKRWSPEQIAATLPLEFPDRAEMRVSHETIYQSIYVQGRGGLRRELAKCLRTGRAIRKPHRVPGEKRGKRDIPKKLMIANRPTEVNNRKIPGHWEGDLILGRLNQSAIATLVERTTRTTLLCHLPPGDHGAEAVHDAMLAVLPTLPEHLRRSLTWDQGAEMAHHADITLATDLDIYFRDPHSPWQRGTNENTNGLLRQYFPKGTDLSAHTPQHLAAIAAELNERPRKTLGWKSPAQALHQLLCDQQQPGGVASTP